MAKLGSLLSGDYSGSYFMQNPPPLPLSTSLRWETRATIELEAYMLKITGFEERFVLDRAGRQACLILLVNTCKDAQIICLLHLLLPREYS